MTYSDGMVLAERHAQLIPTREPHVNRHLLNTLATLCLAALASAVQAQGFAIQITTDENTAHFSNTAGFSQNLTCALQADTGPGGLASAFTCDMLNPPGLTAGDLFVNEFGTTTLGDILRFNPGQRGPAAGLGVFVLYSIGAPLTALADTLVPPSAFYANSFTLTEDATGTVSYTPTAGQPGFVSGAGGPVTYVVHSDTIPEPASLALVGIGAVALVLRRRRKA